MRALAVRAAILAVALPAVAGAQTVSLSESEALSQLAPGSPRVRAARAAVDIARADVLAAGRWPNPRFTFNREAVAGIAEDMFMVSQVLPITGRRGLEVNAASARVAASTSRADEQVRRLRADVRLAFTELWAAQVRETELARSRDRLRELTQIIGRRELAGDAAGFDRLRAEREVGDVDADRATAAVDRARAEAMLLGYFALPPSTARVEAVRTEAAPAPIASLDELFMRAEQTRGDVAALQREIEAAGLFEQAAARRLVPEPEVVAGSKSSSVGAGDIGSVVSLHVSIPLFDRAAPERAAAQARARQFRAEAEVLRTTLRAQIAAWRAALVERRGVADRYRTSVTATAGEIERIARVSYDAGERGILELLDAYRTTAAARLRQAALDAAVREAEIELEFASGWEIP
jgi:outer membrane protein, heavy metal efflux system